MYIINTYISFINMSKISLFFLVTKFTKNSNNINESQPAVPGYVHDLQASSASAVDAFPLDPLNLWFSPSVTPRHPFWDGGSPPILKCSQKICLKVNQNQGVYEYTVKHQ